MEKKKGKWLLFNILFFGALRTFFYVKSLNILFMFFLITF